MSFANPNQILVSRAYYDMASKLTLEIAQMFEKYDMHAYEHDIYAVRLLNEKVAPVENVPTMPSDVSAEDAEEVKSGFNWGVYILPLLLALAMLFALTKWMQSEDDNESIEPALTESMMQEVAPEIEGEAAAELVSEDALLDQEVVAEEETKEDTVGATAEPVKKAAKKKTTKKTTSKQSTNQSKENTKPHQSAVTPEPVEPAPVTDVEEKSGWDKFTESIGQGAADVECSQAQQALNQCN